MCFCVAYVSAFSRFQYILPRTAFLHPSCSSFASFYNIGGTRRITGIVGRAHTVKHNFLRPFLQRFTFQHLRPSILTIAHTLTDSSDDTCGTRHLLSLHITSQNTPVVFARVLHPAWYLSSTCPFLMDRNPPVVVGVITFPNKKTTVLVSSILTTLNRSSSSPVGKQHVRQKSVKPSSAPWILNIIIAQALWE